MPFRKRDAEGIRNISELRASYKGGMIFRPEPGVYEKVHQIDFTSHYPPIIVKYNPIARDPGASGEEGLSLKRAILAA